MGNNKQLKKELKDLFIMGCYYLIEDYLHEELCSIGY
jgi:hypothetical protein